MPRKTAGKNFRQSMVSGAGLAIGGFAAIMLLDWLLSRAQPQQQTDMLAIQTDASGGCGCQATS